MGVGQLKLTIEDLNNMISFGNRAQMQGSEADTWVDLKTRLSVEGQRMVRERMTKENEEGPKAVPGAR